MAFVYVDIPEKLELDYFYNKFYVYEFGLNAQRVLFKDEPKLNKLILDKTEYFKNKKIEDYSYEDKLNRYILNALNLELELNGLDKEKTFIESVRILGTLIRDNGFDDYVLNVLRKCIYSYFLFLYNSDFKYTYNFSKEDKVSLLETGMGILFEISLLKEEDRSIYGNYSAMIMDELLKEIFLDDMLEENNLLERYYDVILELLKYYEKHPEKREGTSYYDGVLVENIDGFYVQYLNLHLNNLEDFVYMLILKLFIRVNDYSGVLKILYLNRQFVLAFNNIFLKSYLLKVFETEEDKTKLNDLFLFYPFLDTFKSELLS